MTPQDFLRADDLELLAEKPLVAEKTPSFKSYIACLAACTGISSCGFATLVAPSACYCGAIHGGAYLQLTEEQVEFSQPTPSCCVLAKTQRSVRYENVTDSTIEDDCCLQMFGLKKLVIQTAGTGGTGDAALAGIQAMFLKDPDAWKLAINHAVKLSKGMGAPGVQGMTRDAVPKAAKLQKAKLDNINKLAQMRVISEAQANAMRIGALLMQEADYPLQLMAMHQLVEQQQLSKQHFEAAVALVLQKIQQ